MTAYILSSSPISLENASPPESSTFQEVCIIFKDGLQANFNRASLINGSNFFKGALQTSFSESRSGIIQMREISCSAFKAVFRFLCEGKTLSEAIEETDLTPLFYEDFMSTLNFLNPLKEALPDEKSLKSSIDEALPHLVTLEQAKAILAAFQFDGRFLSASSRASSKNEAPFLVKVAGAIIFQSTLMPTKKVASDTFRKMRAAQIRRDLASRDVVVSIRGPVNDSSAASAPQRDTSQRFQPTQMDRDLKLLSGHAWKMYPTFMDNISQAIEKLPKKMKALCATYLNDEQPFVKKIAELAQRCLLQEAHETVTALSLCNIDLSSNPELRSHLIGPKAYLLDHYNIQVVAQVADNSERRPDSRLPFRLNGKPWAFDVSQSPKAFEDEIRQDLELMNCQVDAKFGARIIKKDASQPVESETKQENIVAQALHEFKIEKTASASSSSTCCSKAITALFAKVVSYFFSSSSSALLGYAKTKKLFLTESRFLEKCPSRGGDAKECVKQLHLAYLERNIDLTVHIKMRNGLFLSLKMDATQTIFALKKKIFDCEGGPRPEKQILSIFGKILQPDSRCLNEYYLKTGDVLYAYF